jgi:K+-transporting ATPase ATPase C chain
MSSHLRANLWLLLFTVALCSVLYPLALLGVGEVAFPHQAAGSLVDAEGKPVTDPNKARGSLLIAQEFKGDEYFQPRPSNAGSGYEANASGGSNWGASNPLLRDRVARQLGTLARFRDGRPVADAVKVWFVQKDAELVKAKKPGLVYQWAEARPSVVQAWVKADKAHAKLVQEWLDRPPRSEVARWRQENPGKEGPVPADLATAFFKMYSATKPGQWPEPGGDPMWGLAAVFFDAWRQEHPKADLLEVPADMITASGSGLDPHITLKNALYQARWRMAEAWAKKLAVMKKLDADSGRLKALAEKVGREIERLAEDLASAPLGGLVGVRLVNVLEANLKLNRRMRQLAEEI